MLRLYNKGCSEGPVQGIRLDYNKGCSEGPVQGICLDCIIKDVARARYRVYKLRL